MANEFDVACALDDQRVLFFQAKPMPAEGAVDGYQAIAVELLHAGDGTALHPLGQCGEFSIRADPSIAQALDTCAANTAHPDEGPVLGLEPSQ